jgi:hypothetical protein
MATSKSLILSSDPQIVTSFPNQNDKHIDYVITYKYSDNDNPTELKKNELVRKSFLDCLREQEIEIKYIQFRAKNEHIVYILLHCPMHRLFLEAEKMKHEMRIDPVIH